MSDAAGVRLELLALAARARALSVSVARGPEAQAIRIIEVGLGTVLSVADDHPVWHMAETVATLRKAIDQLSLSLDLFEAALPSALKN